MRNTTVTPLEIRLKQEPNSPLKNRQRGDMFPASTHINLIFDSDEDENKQPISSSSSSSTSIARGRCFFMKRQRTDLVVGPGAYVEDELEFEYEGDGGIHHTGDDFVCKEINSIPNHLEFVRRPSRIVSKPLIVSSSSSSFSTFGTTAATARSQRQSESFPFRFDCQSTNHHHHHQRNASESRLSHNSKPNLYPFQSRPRSATIHNLPSQYHTFACPPS